MGLRVANLSLSSTCMHFYCGWFSVLRLGKIVVDLVKILWSPNAAKELKTWECRTEVCMTLVKISWSGLIILNSFAKIRFSSGKGAGNWLRLSSCLSAVGKDLFSRHFKVPETEALERLVWKLLDWPKIFYYPSGGQVVPFFWFWVKAAKHFFQTRNRATVSTPNLTSICFFFFSKGWVSCFF